MAKRHPVPGCVPSGNANRHPGPADSQNVVPSHVGGWQDPRHPRKIRSDPNAPCELVEANQGPRCAPRAPHAEPRCSPHGTVQRPAEGTGLHSECSPPDGDEDDEQASKYPQTSKNPHIGHHWIIVHLCRPLEVSPTRGEGRSSTLAGHAAWEHSSPGRQRPDSGIVEVPPRPSEIRQYALVADEDFTELRSVKDIPPGVVGRRVVVTGLAGAGKSTFSRALSAKTGLPVIHLDIHYWKPGWVKPSEDEWREKQRGLLTGDEWIVDGNYRATLNLRLEHADTAVFLDTPWWVCAWRAFVRGIRKRPAGFQLPDGCDESAVRRLRDECSVVWRIWRGHRSERGEELRILSRHGDHVALYVLRSNRQRSI